MSFPPPVQRRAGLAAAAGSVLSVKPTVANGLAFKIQTPFHEILLGALFWLAAHELLQYCWRRTTRCQAKYQAVKKGSKAKHPFPGLTQKPHCEACAQAAAAVEPAPPDPPPVITPTAGRPPHGQDAESLLSPSKLPVLWLARSREISAPTATPMVGAGVSCTALPAGATFSKLTGRYFTAKRGQPRTSYGRSQR